MKNSNFAKSITFTHCYIKALDTKGNVQTLHYRIPKKVDRGAAMRIIKKDPCYCEIPFIPGTLEIKHETKRYTMRIEDFEVYAHEEI